MKLLDIRYTLLITLLWATACTEEQTEIIYPEPDYAQVELSSRSAVMEREGGQKELFFSANRPLAEVECEADWIDVSIEGNSLTLYVDENTTGEPRLAVIEVVVGSEPDTAVDRFKLSQLANPALDLSAEDTANSYICPTQTMLKFRSDVRGNGRRDGNSRYMATYSAQIEQGAYAEVLWEATFDGDKTRSCDILDGTPIFSPEEGSIYVKTGAIEGNALVGIFGADGELLWSWHLWVTDSEIGTSRHNRITWMDRNLGALSNEMEDIANRGLLYQWGRKEPFLPSSAPYIEVPTHSYDANYNLTETEEEYAAIQAEIEAARELLNINNTQYGNGICRWNFVGFEAPVSLNAPGNIDYAVKHPTTILGCRTDIPIGEYVFDWYMQQDLANNAGVSMQSQSRLWGDAEAGTAYKTIFDPCPPGYCVPPRGAFGEIPSEYACSYVNNEWEKKPYGWRWRGGNGDFFPSVGNLDVSGLMGETSERILYWTAEEFGAGTSGFGKAATLFVAYNDVYYGIYPLFDPSVAGSWYSYGARACAASVRCVKESK